METQKPSQVFDQFYYSHGCGQPYQRDEAWLNFFDLIAKRILRDIQPESILDAGCAWGFLVEGLRKNGGNAWGIDISDYAIQQVTPEVQPYCWVGSITQAFPQKYDLIVSIEVVEHMPQAESELAIQNICQHTDDVLFSSTPFDYKEPTHYNVQPPEYWAEQFAHHGFYRDVDFNASFITPWAVRFRRKNEPVHRIIKEFERSQWLLSKENADLRELVNQMRREISSLHAQVETLDKRWTDHLVELDQNATWKLLQKMQGLRRAMIPQGSRREKWLTRLLYRRS